MSTATADRPFISREEATRNKFFDNRGAKTQEILSARDPSVLCVGPLGTGKTHTLLEKLNACLLKYPGARAILLRSVRKWLTNSALVTWENNVVMARDLVPDKIHRSNRSEYRYRNGSVLVVAGLDNPVAVRSAEYDLAFILEATEVAKEAVEEVEGRLRNGRMPYQQLLMDCNPGPPTHWLKKEIDNAEQELRDGRPVSFRHIDTKHTDNPRYCDPITKQMTPQGKAYVDRLERSLTGTRKARLYGGKWVQADGIVFEDWDSTRNVIESFDIPHDWPRYLIVDFGFTNPLCVQFWAESPDGDVHLYREIYKTKFLIEDAAKWMKRMSFWGDPAYRAVICDHDASERASFEKHSGLVTIPAIKTAQDRKKSGIQNVANRLKPDMERFTDAGILGRPKLYIHNRALKNEPDRTLADDNKPTCTEKEFDGYVWDVRLGHKEEPLKENDHGMDACRYLCRYLDENKGSSSKFHENALDAYDDPLKAMW